MASLRYKFLIVLAGTALITILAFLTMTMFVFKEDKTSYVFDTMLSQTKNHSRSFRSETESYLALTKTLAHATDIHSQEISSIGEFVFSQRADAIHFEVWAHAPGAPEGESLVHRTKTQDAPSLERVKQELLKATEPIHFSIEDPHTGLAFIALRGQEAGTNRSVWSIVAYRSREVLNHFSSSGTGNTFLFDKKQDRLLGSEQRLAPSHAKELQGWLSSLFLPESSTLLVIGEDKFLTTAIDVGFGEIYMVTVIRESMAFAALEQLLRHSMYFAGGLFFLVVLLSLISSRSITSTLSALTAATSEVAKGNFNIRFRINSKDEIGKLSQSFNTMTEEVSRLLSETAEKSRMESELKTAQAVQSTLFPAPEAKWEDFTLQGFYNSASECGGDWWYYYRSGSKVFIWVGDATGHGAPAALITSAARSAASLIEWQPGVGPAQAMRILNRAIHATSKGGMMMTFFIACFDTETNQLTYSNASHNPPYLLNAPRAKDALSKQDFLPLIEANNPRLGQKEDHKFVETSVNLEPGDCLVLFSDGIVELKNAEQKDYGERKFIKSLSKNFIEGQNMKEVIDKVISEAYEYRDGHPLEDDVTLVLAEFKPAAATQNKAA